MLAEGGFFSLWRGNGVNILKIAPESAFKFMAYEYGKRMLKGSSNRELKIEERFLAGSLAGAVSQSLIYPLEVITRARNFTH
jgi:solute carrier family 25 phosphate transporter 23/24/25/41